MGEVVILCAGIAGAVFLVVKWMVSREDREDRAAEWVDPAIEAFRRKADREVDRVPTPRAKHETSIPALLEEVRLIESGRHAEAFDLGRTPADAEFEAVIAQTIKPEMMEKAFYSVIAGTKHRNSDGSGRPKVLKKCETFEALELRPEPENPVDVNAISVHKADTGEQLGYLEARLAGEVTTDRKHGPDRWMAFFRHKNYHPETGHVVGGTIYIVVLNWDQVTQKENVDGA